MMRSEFVHGNISTDDFESFDKACRAAYAAANR